TPPPASAGAAGATPGHQGSSGSAPPGTAPTGSVPPGSAPVERTQSASISDTGPFVELAALLAREAEAASDQKRRADLLVRLGLLFWDVLDDPEAAQRYLTAAGADHPSALRLRLALALAQRDDQALLALDDEMRSAGKEKAPSARRGLDVELAEIWLFRQGDPARAAACCRDLLAQEPGHRGARQLLALALAAQKQWDELCQHLADSPAEDADALLEGARLELDGAGGAKKAAKLAQAALEGESALLYTLELLLELSALGATQTEPLLEKKIAALGDEPRAAAERAAAQFR